MQFDSDTDHFGDLESGQDAHDDAAGEEQRFAQPGHRGEHVTRHGVLHRADDRHAGEQHDDAGGHQRRRAQTEEEIGRDGDQGRDHRPDHVLEEERGPDLVQQSAGPIDRGRGDRRQEAGQPRAAEQQRDAQRETRPAHRRQPAWIRVRLFGDLVHHLVGLVDGDTTGGDPADQAVQVGHPRVVGGAGVHRPHDRQRRTVGGRRSRDEHRRHEDLDETVSQVIGAGDVLGGGHHVGGTRPRREHHLGKPDGQVQDLAGVHVAQRVRGATALTGERRRVAPPAQSHQTAVQAGCAG